MEVQVTVSLNGVDEKLNQLGPRLAKAALRKALKAGAAIIEEDARMRAPVDTGALQDSIKTVVKLSGKQDRGTATVGPTVDAGTKSKPSSAKFNQSPAFYGAMVELGNKHQGPQPFLRPAIDNNAQKVIDVFSAVLKEELEEVVKA